AALGAGAAPRRRDCCGLGPVRGASPPPPGLRTRGWLPLDAGGARGRLALAHLPGDAPLPPPRHPPRRTPHPPEGPPMTTAPHHSAPVHRLIVTRLGRYVLAVDGEETGRAHV